ncbi:MAG: cardiolipin synthase [Hydrocarboniphaga sp.]|uniref:phospholipase D-like domain-containing protein n=1 Tax=Hydrocarboniphaga sp. TaxID=2033016 RepID=UPI002610D9B2|nr:phospholipase D-like domain-containing protein [Hydrocarboniphaga sp.]MDB5972770.1 cardiolipin synthase [Hydrocarboniphaga sp.]
MSRTPSPDGEGTAFVDALAELRERPLVPGNRLRLLRDGPQTHAAQLAAIAGAQHHVHLETYLITDGEVGSRYADALIERARAGVHVRLMLDGLGALGAGDGYRQRLLDAGVHLREFNPVNPLREPRLWRMTRRTHRKTLVVDGRVAFTGGVNITDEYRCGPEDPEAATAGGPGWRDTHLLIEGPAAAEFQHVFLTYWARLGGLRDTSGYYPAVPAIGDSLACAITDQGEGFIDHWVGGEDEPDDDELPRPPSLLRHPLRPKYRVKPRIYHAYRDAIGLAQHRVWITQAYFAPNGRFIRALTRAARRGVDVRLILPAKTDAGLLKYAARQRYARLMRAGVAIHEYLPAVLHAKTAVIDGIWSTIGSANLDYRSFFHNDEANAFLICAGFAADMEAMFEHDLIRCRAIDPKLWRQRGWRERLLEAFAGAIKWML